MRDSDRIHYDGNNFDHKVEFRYDRPMSTRDMASMNLNENMSASHIKFEMCKFICENPR